MKIYSQDTLFAVVRLPPGSPVPCWAAGEFLSVTRTRGELSIVCEESKVPEGVAAQRGFQLLEVEGPLDFALTGVLASIAGPLAAAGISIFAIATYDTDYVLVQGERMEDALAALSGAGWEVSVAIGDAQ